jgi:general secretion pathway protein L
MLNLLPRQAIESSRVSRLDLALAALLPISAAAALGIDLHKQHATAADFDHKVAAARQEAERSLNLLENIADLTSSMKLIIDYKKVNIRLTRVLAELTHCIPDEAYVAQLDINDRDVRIKGYAQSASNLIGSLEQSPLFEKAEFLSPITIDPHNGRERFQIAVRIQATGG